MRTGLVHLLVVSGQHFLVLEAMLDFLTRKLPSVLRIAFSMLILGGFVLVTGGAPPALRSGLSWAARNLNSSFHFGWTPIQVVLFSVVTSAPFCLANGEILSLVLSGVAAAALASRPTMIAETLIAKVKAAVATQTRIYLLLIPALSPFTFQHPVSIIWNLSVGSLVGQILFPMSLAAILLPPLADFADRAWELTIRLVAKLSEWTPASPLQPVVPETAALAYAALLFFFVVLRERRLRALGIAAMLTFSMRVDASEVIVWNVGQGSWATVVDADHCRHFDAGGEFAPWTTIRATCEGRKNEMAFSHWDWDHVSFARRAAETLGGCISARPGGSPKPSRVKLLEGLVTCPASENKWTENTASTRRDRSSNASSRVFSLANAIFTGDAPKKEEKRLGRLERTRLLIVSHHGSKTSSAEEFLKRIAPKMAIVSARTARYGHPHREVVQRMKKLGIALLKTEDWGSIRVEMKRAKPYELRPPEKSEFSTIRVCKRDTPC